MKNNDMQFITSSLPRLDFGERSSLNTRMDDFFNKKMSGLGLSGDGKGLILDDGFDSLAHQKRAIEQQEREKEQRRSYLQKRLEERQQRKEFFSKRGMTDKVNEAEKGIEKCNEELKKSIGQ